MEDDNLFVGVEKHCEDSALFLAENITSAIVPESCVRLRARMVNVSALKHGFMMTSYLINIQHSSECCANICYLCIFSYFFADLAAYNIIYTSERQRTMWYMLLSMIH